MKGSSSWPGVARRKCKAPSRPSSRSCSAHARAFLHPFRRRHHGRHQRPGGRHGPAIRRPRAGLRLPAPVVAPRRPGGPESPAICPAVQFFGLGFQPLGAAARLDRYYCRRHRPAARKASELCRRQISRSECIVALAGGRVGVVEDAALPSDRQFIAPQWQDCPNLVHFPWTPCPFALSWWTNSLANATNLPRPHGSPRGVHQVGNSQEASLLPWGDLPEALKISNFHQVVYAEISSDRGPGHPPDNRCRQAAVNMQEFLGKAGLERLAEMEHGRWNVERLLLGWRWAEVKDVGRKLPPISCPGTGSRLKSRSLNWRPSAICREFPRGPSGGILS